VSSCVTWRQFFESTQALQKCFVSGYQVGVEQVCSSSLCVALESRCSPSGACVIRVEDDKIILCSVFFVFQAAEHSRVLSQDLS
jgi:hypothetical protein